MRIDNLFGGLCLALGVAAGAILWAIGSSEEEVPAGHLLEPDPTPNDPAENKEYLRKITSDSPITRIRSIPFRRIELCLNDMIVSAINTDHEDFALCRIEGSNGAVLLEKMPYHRMDRISYVECMPLDVSDR